jgi:hypothetical protein
MPSINQQLAKWVTELQCNNLPQEVVTQTKFRVLDMVGAMLGGLNTELVTQVSKATFCSLAGNAFSTPCCIAAMLTGMAVLGSSSAFLASLATCTDAPSSDDAFEVDWESLARGTVPSTA